MVKVGDNVIQTPTVCGDQGLTEGNMPKVGNKILISKSTDSSNSNKLITHGISSMKIGDNVISKPFYNKLIAVKGGRGLIPLGFWFIIGYTLRGDPYTDQTVISRVVVFDREFNVIYNERVYELGQEDESDLDTKYIMDYMQVYTLSDGTKVPVASLKRLSKKFKLFNDDGEFVLERDEEVSFDNSISFCYNDQIYINTGGNAPSGLSSDWNIYNPYTLELVGTLTTSALYYSGLFPEYLPVLYLKGSTYVTAILSGGTFPIIGIVDILSGNMTTSFGHYSYKFNSYFEFCDESVKIYTHDPVYFYKSGAYLIFIAHQEGEMLKLIRVDPEFHVEGNCYSEEFCYLYKQYGMCFVTGETDRTIAKQQCLREECNRPGGAGGYGIGLEQGHTIGTWRKYNFDKEELYIDTTLYKILNEISLGYNIFFLKQIDNVLWLQVDNVLYAFDSDAFKMRYSCNLLNLIPEKIGSATFYSTYYQHTGIKVTDVFVESGRYYILFKAGYEEFIDSIRRSWDTNFVIAVTSSFGTFFEVKRLYDIVNPMDDEYSDYSVDSQSCMVNMNLD